MEGDTDAGTTIGPIQLVVIGFPRDAQFRGEIIRALSELRGRGVVRLIDALFVRKDDQGRISATMRESDVTLGQRETLGAVVGGLMGYIAGGEEVAIQAADETARAIAEGAFGLGLGDLQNIKDKIGPGQAALLLLVEHTWATALKGAVRGAGGVPLLQGFLTPEALVLVGAEVRAAVEAEATIALAEAVKGAAVLDALAVVEEAEAVKQAAAAEAARALLAAGLIEEAAAQEVVETLVAAELIEAAAAAEAAAAVEQANAQVQEVEAAQMQRGEGAGGATPADGQTQAPPQGTTPAGTP
jgi:uncharacterized membrane protein